jgi:drug/metabolite transporter (DMT)-like permease
MKPLPALPAERRLFALGIRLFAVSCLATMTMIVKLASASGVRLPEIMFWRQIGAIPVVLAWVLAGPGLASLKTSRFSAHARRSVLGTTGMIFTFGSVILLPLAESTTIGFTVPIFATILSALVLKEKVRLHRWSAVAIGFAGVLIVVQPGGGDLPLKGAAVGIIAALMIGIISLQLRDLGRTEAPPTTVFWFAIISGAALGLLHVLPMPGAIGQALAWGSDAHNAHQWLLLFAIGAVGGVGQMALTASLRYAPISTVVGMDYVALIWSTLYGWLIWGALPGPSTWLGAPIIVASGLYIAWREHRLNVERVREITT